MVSIGNTTLPGVATEITSAANTTVNVGASAQVGLIGQADLANGTANANEVYEITRPVQAKNLFGDGSLLQQNCADALSDGAYPVYAVATAESTTTEDISGASSTSITLANAPVIEDMSAVTVTVDGTELSVLKTYEDAHTKSPGSSEAYLNPVEGTLELGVAPGDADSTNDTVQYTHYDYNSATDALRNGAGEIVDFIGVINENQDAVGYAHDVANQMVSNYNFAVVVAGAASHISDPANFTPSFDSSRIQLLYPGRTTTGGSVIGRYLGLRASLGINTSPIFKRLGNTERLAETLSVGDRENLVGANVTPLANEAQGAKVVEDLTTVTDSNSQEANMRQVMHRLIVDYVTNVVHAASEQFIGKLHKQSARNSLESVVTSEMNGLMDMDAITAFTVNCQKIDAMTASLDVGIDTIDPLRNIEATVTAGQVE